MRELLIRSVAGIVMIAVALLAVIKGGTVLVALAGLVGVVLLMEWLRLVRGWHWSWGVSGLLYALGAAISLIWLRGLAQDGIAITMWTFIVTWSTDIGAYFAGRTLGRTKLAPAISPNKTVEGLAGGVLAAAIFGGAWVLGIGLEQRALLLLAPLFALLAQAGDLFESGMKRRAGVKDSGHWLPGHGGILDRLDGFVPVVIATALLFAIGLL
ncbi:phosphatidate cytidylyltransferase [Sphingomonas piscis]|uniref:Phosphatidate cytidylyltransferase n=1 Tax=Sphingomonas piscis TaxID=2714943 RepID=A0A6G7YLF3_9SPHN|nr:phosphatidate cytidylyltransferase [Sphingomonas piscis]QIK77568.1 phosphatidate cytidylyltransferase [Sphingomonas piscis]